MYNIQQQLSCSYTVVITRSNSVTGQVLRTMSVYIDIYYTAAVKAYSIKHTIYVALISWDMAGK